MLVRSRSGLLRVSHLLLQLQTVSLAVRSRCFVACVRAVYVSLALFVVHAVSLRVGDAVAQHSALGAL